MRSKQFLVVVEEEALAFTRPEAVELFESCGLTREQAHIALDHTMDAPERCTTAPSSCSSRNCGPSQHATAWRQCDLATAEVMSSQTASTQSINISVDDGLIPFGHANLPAIQHSVERQQSMLTVNRKHTPAPQPRSAETRTVPSPRHGFFLRTKLIPPRPAPELLSRPRLTNRLLSNLNSPHSRNRKRRIRQDNPGRRFSQDP